LFFVDGGTIVQFIPREPSESEFINSESFCKIRTLFQITIFLGFLGFLGF